MRTTKGMAPEELRAEIQERKLRAFDQCKMLLDADAKVLAASGFKSPADVIRFAARMIEARTKDWERNNPA